MNMIPEELKAGLADDKDNVLIENNAQTIFDHLASLHKQRELHEKRWFWELLQNAKDAVEKDEKVRINVELKDNMLRFLHTGNPFARKDILHLIFHGSSKKNLEGKTGRFGTGFMTTHLLAMQVKITGRLKDGFYFQFVLDREASSPLDQHSKLNNSFDNFQSSLRKEPYSNDSFETVFEFELDQTSRLSVQQGIEQLSTILPVVLALNDKITEIAVTKDEENFTIVKTERVFESEKIEDLSMVIREYRVGNNEKLQVYIFSNADSDIALVIRENDEGLEIVELDESYPKLFYDFPLFGTENIGMPIIVNSKFFDPRTERDGIYLGKEDKIEIAQNKRILSAAVTNSRTILKYLSDKKVECLYHLFRYEMPDNYPWLYTEWLTEVYIVHIVNLFALKVISLEKEEDNLDFSLSELKLSLDSVSENLAWHKLVTEFWPKNTPGVKETGVWLDILTDYAEIQKVDMGSYECVLTIEKIASQLHELGNLDMMESQLVFRSEDGRDTFDWLADFYSLVDRHELRNLAFRYKILPNELGQFVIRTQEGPYIDNVPSSLKVIAENHRWTIREVLLHSRFEWDVDEYPEMELSMVFQELDRINTQYTPDNLNEKKVRIAIIEQLRWIIENKAEDYMDNTPVLVFVERHSNPQFNGYQKRKLIGEEKLVAPYGFWSNRYGRYKSIVRERLLLCDEYCELLSEEHFIYLSDRGAIYISPLIKVRKRATKTDLRLLALNAKEQAEIQNMSDGQEVFIEFTDIPHLSGDDNILSKTKASVLAAKQLLAFIINEILPVDPFGETEQIVNVDKRKIKISQQMWIGRLRNNQWVPVNPIGEDQPGSEAASAKNLIPLLDGDNETLNRVNTRSSAIFLNKLGISIADIQRNAIKSEDTRLMWDLTFSSLITHPDINPELAVEMLSDHGLQQEYIRRQQERSTIAKNQQIGSLFEKIFKSLFEKEEYVSQGIKIERRAVGSDFDIVTDMDYVDEDNKEIKLQAGNIIIELKATSKNVAEMTTTQAQDAVNYRSNYTLAVLPLSGFDITEDNVKQHARFVTNIGEILDPNVGKYKDYVEKKHDAQIETEKVKVAIEDSKIRYQVKEKAWLLDSENPSTIGFDAFLELLVQNNISSVRK